MPTSRATSRTLSAAAPSRAMRDQAPSTISRTTAARRPAHRDPDSSVIDRRACQEQTPPSTAARTRRAIRMTVDHLDTEPTAPLTPLLQDAKVGWEALEDGYRPLLALVDTVLGVIPRCDQYLEIWPVGFRSYNVLVPNLLDLPVPVLGVGGPPPSAVGLAMYVASRTAGCA